MARVTPICVYLLLMAFVICSILIGCQQSSVAYLPPHMNTASEASGLSVPPAVSHPPVPMPDPARVDPPLVTANPFVIPGISNMDVPADWVVQPPYRQWQWIIIHHSATTYGNAKIIDQWHRDRGFDELGYHFVIGNGNSSGDGQVEVGPRWPKQKWGAHTKTADNRFNDFGIGICLVGNFDVDRPTTAQLKSVTKLVAYLMETFHIPPDHILGHSDAKATDCPGKYLSVAQLREMANKLVMANGISLTGSKALAASEELLVPQ
jgi:hypothetical protein